ncbi:glutamate-cysteine ligase [Nocardioides albertanoniae]|uniref:Glutamate-cysteine ligase n=1 Tax=Nocardioides albertanoniae TaxID=1175486 RepID=A0A543A5D7_9ACTN|nr:glutamate-cysteine ligase family protein [Nocardioides albertanoniae]TQL67813.1 glutamate-cysteine ligase [Nocardioides albertanoniae]
MLYSAGLEFEYALVTLPSPGGTDTSHATATFHDFADLDFETLQQALADGPGAADPELVRGDLGIKGGYWYLEGDERFDPEGTFTSMLVKGLEIRTPICSSTTEATDRLIELQAEVSGRLAPLGLRLGIVGFNPVREAYVMDPPLNEWEQAMRAEHREYDHAEVSNLSYGPDINLSFPGLGADQVVGLARRLTHYSPFMVPFSFSSPFHAGHRWRGPSKRTYERTWRRVATRCFVSSPPAGADPLLVHPPRVPREEGRIEFKAYDAFLSRDLLLAGTALALGVCLADDLPGLADAPSRDLHQRSATAAFADPEIAAGARDVLTAARRALAGRPEAGHLDVLDPLLSARRTPADTLLDAYSRTGLMFHPEGLR